jgi:prophage antirepressor-like protein
MSANQNSRKIVVFESRKIRRILHNDEWWFVVVDVVSALTDSADPTQYVNRMRQRDLELSKGWVQIVHTLSIDTAGGKQKLNCANTEGIFRIIQSIPSPKAEPFKLWLAKVGYERIQEIENPELATQRTRALYKAKGYNDDWIEKRLRGIAIRDELTDQWQKRGVKGKKEYEILTAEISKATFGMTPSLYKKYKGLKRENLRDHMTDLELIFSMLGEASTKEISINKNTQGLIENKKAAIEGGNIRKELERKSGKKVISRENYKQLTQKQKSLK